MLHHLFLAGAVLAADGEHPSSAASEQEKRWNVARDFAAVLPVGEAASDAGPMVGALVRVGFEPRRGVEVAIRSGYLYGLDKPVAEDRVTALSAIPILASARWFAFGRSVGPYVGIEAGTSLLRRRYRSTAESALLSLDFDATESKWTMTATAGAGWVISRKVPIDLRGEVAALDLVGGRIAVGATAGWTIYF